MGKLFNELTEAFDYYSDFQNQKLFAKSLQLSEDLRSSEILIPQYSLQNRIRPLFGKVGHNIPSIGHHPDFTYLPVPTIMPIIMWLLYLWILKTQLD